MPSGADSALAWAIRPATRPDVGGGHVARCSALGAALALHGPVVAIVEKGGEFWHRRFAESGIAVVPECDLGGGPFAGIVLDDYDFRPSDIARWRTCTIGPIVQIDDHGTPLLGIDLAVNATPGLNGFSLGKVPALLGASFAMLAAPYAGRLGPRIRRHIDRVVVAIGWNDANGITERVLAALGQVLQPPARVDVVLGAMSPNIARVAAMVNAAPNWRLHRDVAQPWLLLDGADMAVSGAGQSLLERLAFGIPTLAIATADNQMAVLAGVAGYGAAHSLGTLKDDLSEDRIASAFSALARDADRRSKMSVAAQRLVDGHGASRVARHLVSQVALR